MPDGKPAGVRCVQLTDDHRCKVWGKPERPQVCNQLRANVAMCGETFEHAMAYLARLEAETRPGECLDHEGVRTTKTRSDAKGVRE
jgi:hypothetical protein